MIRKIQEADRPGVYPDSNDGPWFAASLIIFVGFMIAIIGGGILLSIP